MRPPGWFRPLAVATAAFLVSAHPTLLEAQGRQGQGRPSFPPGLHDRTLPPGRPFDGGDFRPPGRRGADDEDTQRPDAVAAHFGRLLAAPAFPAGGTLPGGSVQLRRQARPWMIPGMAAATPIGFGASFGTVWAGASYQPRARYSDGQTGGAAVGFGVGDGERLVGLQVAINSFSTVSSGFGKRMALDLHLHRRIGELWGVAVGWESVAAPITVTRDSRENLYAVGSRWLQLRGDPDAPFGLAMLSLGLGTGRFQTESRFVDDAGGVGPFGSFGVRVAPPVTLIAEWTGQDVLLAASVTPLRNQRLAITAGFAEVTGAAGDGARFTIGGSYASSFR